MSLALLVAFALTIPSDTLYIQFVGNAGFVVSDGTVSLVTDLPYRSGAFGYMSYAVETVQPPGRVVAVITHRHDDHFDGKKFAEEQWEIVGPREVTAGLPHSRIINLAPKVSVGPFTITPIRTPHRDTEHYSYVIGWRGRRLYFTGDTEDPTQLLEIDDVDIAFVTPWLLCEVARRGATIDARQIVLHHQYPDRAPRKCLPNRTLAQGERLELLPEVP